MQNRRRLTTREVTVVELVSQGLTNGEVGRQLGVSLATVKRHLNNIMIKWNCNNRTQVAVQATLRAAEVAAAAPLLAEGPEAAAVAGVGLARAG